MKRFAGRNVIVTGAAQGIGRGIVQAFLDEGATVFAADVRADGLAGTAALAPDRVTHARRGSRRLRRRARRGARRSTRSAVCMCS